MDKSPESCSTGKASSLRDSQGWDGKLRVEKKAVITNAEILSDPEYSDEDAPPVEQISADEGTSAFPSGAVLAHISRSDLLEEYEADAEVCRCLFHKSISRPY